MIPAALAAVKIAIDHADDEYMARKEYFRDAHLEAMAIAAIEAIAAMEATGNEAMMTARARRTR